MDKVPFTAHQDEPRTLGGRLPRVIADVLAHDRSFLDALEQQRPLTFEGTVTALQRDNTGVNRVQVQRTGQAAAEATWYTVWGTFYVPIVGDQVRMLLVGRGAAVLLGAKHGGRPNEWTVAYSGGALHKYDSGRLHIHKHGDDHHHRHYQTDGSTIAHHHGATGQHAHVGDHVMGGGGGLTIGDTGTPSGTYHKKTHNNSRYEHYQGSTLVRHHSLTDHGHYSSGSLIHNIVTVGTAGGSVKLKQHNAAAYHQHGDDGTGLLYMQHASGNRALEHTGTRFSAYANGNYAYTATYNVVTAGAYSHHFYHSASASGDTELAVVDPAGSTAASAGGRVRFKQYSGTGGAGGSTPHVVGDDGAGNMHALSQSAVHALLLANGAYQHTHAQHTHTFPSTAYHQAPTTDSSVINSFTPGGVGAIKRASHSTTPQVVGTGSATITTDNNIAHYQWPSGANGDPHLKLIMACVWDSGAISNPGFYNHVPACAKGTTKSYGAELYNTSGGGTNSSYVWGTQALANDSQAWIYATQLGGAGNKAVGTALWAHVVN